MYACIFIKSQLQKSETSAKLEKEQNYKPSKGGKQASIKALHCFISQSDHR